MSAPGPGSGGFRVDPDDVGARATAVDGLAERLRETAGGAFPVDPSAYGLVGRLFAGSAQAAAAEASAVIGDLSTATGGAARTLRAVQAAYLDVEAVMAARFRELGL